MSWADKAHKKHQIHKLVEQAMNSKKYQDAEREKQQQAALRAFCRFCFIGCEYLELKHGYRKNGLENFLKFAKGRVEEIGEGEKYFEDAAKYYKEEIDLDVMGILRMKFEKESD
ncbi:hypothetical protein LIR45_01395 [Lachnospiraceae bacterium EP-SM-12S-S03]|nr:hypothetical protein [Lachnospiraceae bacterium EP-SM-12S-S03]